MLKLDVSQELISQQARPRLFEGIQFDGARLKASSGVFQVSRVKMNKTQSQVSIDRHDRSTQRTPHLNAQFGESIRFGDTSAFPVGDRKRSSQIRDSAGILKLLEERKSASLEIKRGSPSATLPVELSQIHARGGFNVLGANTSGRHETLQRTLTRELVFTLDESGCRLLKAAPSQLVGLRVAQKEGALSV